MAVFRNPFRRQHTAEPTRRLFAPPGNFYSPIVDPDELQRSGWIDANSADPTEIDMNYPRQLELFRRLARHFAAFQTSDKPGFTRRCSFPNDQFSRGDAQLLSAFITEFRPRRIIEVGSGYSSAVILDTLEATGLGADCLFIEPFPERLKGLLRPGEERNIRLVESPVQQVDLAVFDRLGKDDILFLDTTHVVKTGSDVLHHLFEVLPRLKPGVIIHFHDVFSGFEYPAQWVIDENRSWNEIYLLRAFLADNARYRIELQVNSLQRRFPAETSAIAPGYVVDGGSLWLRKVA